MVTYVMSAVVAVTVMYVGPIVVCVARVYAARM